MSVSRRTQNSLSTLSDEEIQLLASGDSMQASQFVTALETQPTGSSTLASTSSPPSSASASSSQLSASVCSTTRLAQHLHTTAYPRLSASPSTPLLATTPVLAASSLPLPYTPARTWPQVSLAYVLPPSVSSIGVSTTVVGQPMPLQSSSPPPSLFTFPGGTAAQQLPWLPFPPQSSASIPPRPSPQTLWRYPSDVRYTPAVEPIHLASTSAVPPLPSSAGPSQVAAHLAGSALPLPGLPASTGPSLDATGMPFYYSPGTPALKQDFVVGPGFNPVPYKTVVAITSGQYIDLATLLTPPQPPAAPIISMDGRVVFTAPQRPPRRLTEISDWLQAFTIYMMIVVSYVPHRARNLLAYQLLILRTSKQFKGLAWCHYDEAFRRDAAARAISDWSRVHLELYNYHTPIGWTVSRARGRSWALPSVTRGTWDGVLVRDRSVDIYMYVMYRVAVARTAVFIALAA